MANPVELVHHAADGWHRSNSHEYAEVINPATAETLARVPLGTREDVDAVVKGAAAAFPEWRRTPAGDRIQYLFKFKQLLEDNLEDLARTITQENGKTLAES